MSEFLETTVDKFIFRVAADRRFSADGIWILDIGGGRVRLGVSDYVQQRNGDAAFVHLKPIGTRLAVDDEFAELETIKTTVSLASPVSGEIMEINNDLELSPELVNQEPYGRGWLATVNADRVDVEKNTLLDAEAYLAEMRRQAEAEMGA